MPDPVKLSLVGVDGNAFMVMGVWKRAAQRQGWSKEDIDKVLAEATSDDYKHLLLTIMDNCEDPDDGLRDDDDDSDDWTDE